MTSLYNYQKLDAAQIGGMPSVLLASDAGTGKTATLITAAEHLASEMTERGERLFVVVVCPAVVRGVWEQEWKRWSVLNWNVLRINKGEDIAKIAALKLTQQNVVIVSYDQFSRMEGPKKAKVSPIVEAIAAHTPYETLIIADECHYLKGATSNRTVAVYGLAERLDATMWIASATPAPNHYGEMYPAISKLWPEELAKRGLTTQEAFEDHFCVVRTIWMNGRDLRTIAGSKNGKELKELLTPHMIRRKKEDVLKDLPAMTIDTLPLDAPPNVSAMLDRVGQLVDDFSDEEALGWLARQTGNTHIATARRETGMAKVAQCVEWITNFLTDPAAKLVVFAYHTEVIDALMDALVEYKPVKIDGRTPARDRDGAVSAFQTQPGHRVFVGQIVAAGTGITLTAASNVLFVESDWTPSTNLQAASRCHRIGQRDNVLVRHAVLQGSIDEKIGKALVRKEQELAEIFA